MENTKTGVFREGKKFIVFNNGEKIGESYIERSSEIILEKAQGIYVERRGRKSPSQSSNLIFAPAPNVSELVFESIPEIAVNSFHINERFSFLEKAVMMVGDGIQPSLVVSGAGGLGKTFTVRKTLDELGLIDMSLIPEGTDVDGNESYIIIKGYSTAKNLYRALYNNNGRVIVLDDIDNILKDAVAVNILKACLDSYERRLVSWGSEMRGSEDNLPRTFEFTGQIIFITNMNAEKVDQAIRSRSLMIDVSMTLQETVERMTEITQVKSFLPEYCISVKNDALAFIDRVKERSKELSLRTLITVCKIRHEFPNDWESMAEYIICGNKVTI